MLAVHSAVLATVIVLVAFNSACTLAKKVLDRVAPKSKADSIVGRIAQASSKVLEFVSANSTALPADVKAELPAPAKGA